MECVFFLSFIFSYLGYLSHKITFFHLRNIAKMRSVLSMADAEMLIHAFVSSRPNPPSDTGR